MTQFVPEHSGQVHQNLQLGARIREIRKEKGITQVQLAHSLGKDQPSIQRLEAGNINPSYFYLREIATGLGVSIAEILEGLE